MLIMTSHIYSDTLNTKVYHQLVQTLQIQGDQVKNISAFTDILLPIKRVERKEICLKLVKTYKDTNPKVAYHAANCLLYNGYGNLAIPLFSRYIYNGYNKKYFNNRIGYGWLHAANWYKIDTNILSKMLDGLDFYPWVTQEINNEILSHPHKYPSQAVPSVLKQKLRQRLKEKPMTTKEKQIFAQCPHIKIFIENYICQYDKKTNGLVSCHKSDTVTNTLLGCER